MKFNVPSKLLYSRASAVSKVINSKNTMTILNKFLFSLKGDMLTITASDIENTLSARVPVTEAQGNGSFCVDARRLVELLKELPDQGITFDINDNNYAIEISYLSGKYNVIGNNGAEYPADREQPAEGEFLKFECPAKQVIQGIDRTIFAVGNDDLWPQMMGILWDIHQDDITFVATDSRKLVKYVNRMSAPGTQGSFILPVKPASILKNILGLSESDVAVTIEPKCVTFETDIFSFNSRFIKGKFPDYTRVIPTSNPYEVTLDRVAFINALRRVAIFVEEGSGLVRFRLTPSQLQLKALDNALCTSGMETLDCAFTGTEMVIGFSAAYLIEIASTISSSDIIIKLSDPSRPALFVPSENDADSDLLMLLSPMTVQEF